MQAVRELVDRYMISRKRHHTYASVSAAKHAVEDVLGKGKVEISLMHELIAEHAIAHGLAVDFDGNDTPPVSGTDGGEAR